MSELSIAIELRGGEQLEEAIRGLEEPLKEVAKAMEGMKYRQKSLGHIGQWKSLGLTLDITMDFQQRRLPS